MSAAADIVEALFATAHLDAADVDHLVRLGVDGATIGHLTALTGVPAVGIAEVEAVGDGLFQFAPGARHVIQPVMADGAIIDLVAWRSLQPTAWRLLRGAGWILGADLLDRALAWPDAKSAPHLCRTPADWLRTGGEGLCVLDWSAQEVRGLAQLATIEVPDPEFAEFVLAEISRPARLPEMRVRRRRDAA